MGLRSAILDAVSSAVSAVGDIAEDITYTVKAKGAYDVYSGQLASTDTDYTIKAIVSFDDKTISGKASSTEVGSSFTGELSVMFSAKGLSFTPKTDDVIVRSNKSYSVTDIKQDPAGASYSLKLRKLG